MDEIDIIYDYKHLYGYDWYSFRDAAMESATRLSSIQKEVKDYFLSKEFNEKVKDLISKFLER